MSRERPHLRLEQVAERIDRRRVVGVPGEVAEQALGLVAGAERDRAVFRGRGRTARSCASAPSRCRAARAPPWDRSRDSRRPRADVDRARLDPQRVDHELARGRDSPCSTCDTASERRSRSRAERARGEIGRHRRIDAARDADDGALESSAWPSRRLMKCTSHSSVSFASISSGSGRDEWAGADDSDSGRGRRTSGRLHRASRCPSSAVRCPPRRQSAPSYSSRRRHPRVDPLECCAMRCGIITSRSAMSGMSARARVTSSRSTDAVTIASSQSGPRTRRSPFGPMTHRAPGNIFAALAADEIRERDEDRRARRRCRASAAPSDSRSRDRRSPFSCGHGPRAGGARHEEDELRAIERGDRRRSCCARRPRRRASPRVPTTCRTRAPRVRARRSAPRRTFRTSAGRSCDARGARPARRRRASRTSRCCTACSATPRRSRARRRAVRGPVTRARYSSWRSRASVPAVTAMSRTPPSRKYPVSADSGRHNTCGRGSSESTCANTRPADRDSRR